MEYTPEAYLQSDLNLFYSNLQRQIPSGYGPTVDSIDGGVVQTTTKSFDDNGEADLDLQYAIALGTLLLSTSLKSNLIEIQFIHRKLQCIRPAILLKELPLATFWMHWMLHTVPQEEEMTLPSNIMYSIFLSILC